MPDYRVNQAAVRQARRLIDDGRCDDRTEWSEAAPDAAAANDVIDREGFDAFAAWHLAEDPEASEGTKGRYAFPYGDLAPCRVPTRACERRGQGVLLHDAIEKAADDLLQRLDARREG
jgi:hypothetical protein